MEVQFKDLEIGKVYACWWGHDAELKRTPLIFLFSGVWANTDFLRGVNHAYDYGTCANGRGAGEGNFYRKATADETRELIRKRISAQADNPRSAMKPIRFHRSVEQVLQPQNTVMFNFLP